MYSNKKVKYINSIKEMNEILKLAKRICKHWFNREKTKGETFKNNCYVTVNKTAIEVSFCPGLKPCTYVCRLDGEENKNKISGKEAYRVLHKYYKEDKISKEKLKHIGSAKQLLYKNEAYANKRVKAYGYDMNSAFAAFMTLPIPDITTMRKHGKFDPNTELGFNEIPGGELRLANNPRYADYIFKAIESPYSKFVNNFYDKKAYADRMIIKYTNLISKTKDRALILKYKNLIKKHKNNRNKYKQYLNFAVGYMQNTNPFIRATIIGRCNYYMSSLIDENTIYANTDSIVSTVKRPDIEEMLGAELGLFKLEHDGDMFAWADKCVAYQWNLDIPSWKGCSKGWFKQYNKLNNKHFDVLIDTLPYKLNKFKYDDINKQIIKVSD